MVKHTSYHFMKSDKGYKENCQIIYSFEQICRASFYNDVQEPSGGHYGHVMYTLTHVNILTPCSCLKTSTTSSCPSRQATWAAVRPSYTKYQTNINRNYLSNKC